MKKILSIYFYKTAFAAFVFLVSSFFVTQYNHYIDLRDAYLNTAQRISQGLSSQFSFFYHNAQNITYNRSVVRLNGRESTEYFDSLVALYPYYDVIMLTDKQGKYVASNTIGSEGEALNINRLKSAETVFVAKSASEDLGKGFIGTTAQDFEEHAEISALYGHKKVGMWFSSAVRNRRGETVGYVTTFINHRWLKKEIQSLSEEFFNPGNGGFEVYLLNKDKKALASNRDIAPLSPLPFNVTTANFSKHTKEWNVPEGLLSFFRFAEHPFFVISRFNHQNFLSEMGWSLLIKASKEKALASIINSLAWFWGAFLLFILVAQGIKNKASQKLEGLWKLKEAEGELSFEEALERASSRELILEARESALAAMKLARFEIPGADMGETKVRLFSGKPGDLAIGTLVEIKASLREMEGGLASFDRSMEKSRLHAKKQSDAQSAVSWNLEKANSLLNELRVYSLNVEMEQGDTAKARGLDGVVEKIQVYLEEASRKSGDLFSARAESHTELNKAWSEERGKFLERLESWRQSLETVGVKIEEMNDVIATYGDQTVKFNEKKKELALQRENASNELKALVCELEYMASLLGSDQTEDIKKAA